jgi:hypothetical protein
LGEAIRVNQQTHGLGGGLIRIKRARRFVTPLPEHFRPFFGRMAGIAVLPASLLEVRDFLACLPQHVIDTGRLGCLLRSRQRS